MDVSTIAICEGRIGEQVTNRPIKVMRRRMGKQVRVARIGEKIAGSPTPSYTSHCIVFNAGGVGWWWSSPSDAIKDAIRIVLDTSREKEWDKRVEIRLDSVTDG